MPVTMRNKMSMNNKKILIEAKNLSVVINNKTLINNISLSIHNKEIITLIGPNGAGKTTLIRALLGLLPITSGTITRHPKLTIGYMPQKLTLSENMPLSVKRFLALSKKADQSQLSTVAEQVRICHLLNDDMQNLSGGEHQRVLLAKALLTNPDLLVLDEPVQGVDVTGQAELYGLISSIRDERGTGVLMISHDLHLVMSSTDHVLCVNQHICCSGHPDTVTKHPAYLELFGHPAADNLALYTHHHDHTHDSHGDIETQCDHHG